MSIFTRTHHWLGTLAVLATLLAPIGEAIAGEASLQVPRREGYVGSPLPIRIIISNSETDVAPEMPQVAGLDIQRLANPSVNSSFQSINGQVTQSRETTWTFLVTADRAGDFSIPAFDVDVDGTLYRTSPIDLIFVKSEADDLLQVAVSGSPDTIYLGESTTLTLRIWIKPYRDDRYSTELSAMDMWNLVSRDSTWGPFADAVDTMYQQRKAPRGRLVEVPGTDDGEMGLAYLYEIQVDDWPDRVGTIDAGSVRVDMQYPLSLTRNRSFFSSGLAIGDSRPVSASPPRVGVDVMELPGEGRPAWFSGAVGRFVFDVSASPTTVAVGDPITLTMTVRDQSRRPANLDLLQAPALEHMPELDADFRVPREQLGGTVQGRSKTFTQTIRADNDSVTEIPALPFPYFDPVSRRYETSWSRPIELTVSASAQISTEDVLAASGPIQSTPESLRNVAGGILANYTGPQLLEDQTSRPGIGWLILLLLPPLAVIGTATAHRRRMQLLGDAGRTRSRSALRTARGRLTDAADIADIAESLTGYVADRLNLPMGGLTRQNITTHLRDAGAPESIIDDVDAVLAECEHRHYAGGTGNHDAALATTARACIDELEGVRLR